jgi:PEP-CTERM motif
MRRSIFCCVGLALLMLSSTAQASVIRLDTDPFAGSTALTTPGRQIVGGEDFITFLISADVFSLESTVFGVPGPVQFVNALAADVPTGGVNVVVLQTFDDDANPATPFAAGNAANLIASRITTPGPGFFIYFNQGLDLPRLVFSTDLDDNTADLKILARMLNLTGQGGRDAVPTFTAANFEITTTPEPSSLALFAVAGVAGAFRHVLRRKRGTTNPA